MPHALGQAEYKKDTIKVHWWYLYHWEGFSSAS